MSKARYPLKLPVSIKKAAQRLAKEDGVSLNQWIASAVAQKVGPEGCPVQASLGRGLSTAQSKSPEIDSGLQMVPDDARQLHPNRFWRAVK